MRYLCLATDYDGTIASDGKVAPPTAAALKRVTASGRKLILVTGRIMEDLLATFPDVALFDLVVAENGAVLYNPATQEQRRLTEPPPLAFVAELRRRNIQPLDVGQCIVATWHPFETQVLEVIRSQGLELQVIFNKGAVMILPSGVNKGTGLTAALDELKLSRHNALGFGDAENDHAFLAICECSVAVANALPTLKERADVVTTASHGAGVEEIIGMLLADDLASIAPRLKRHEILLGHGVDGAEVRLKPYDSRVMIAGPSRGGKSTIVTAIVERLIECGYQVCIVDPEGDYDDFADVVTLGGPDRIPGVSEILEVLITGRASMSVNLLGIPLADRPGFFVSLLPRLQELRTQTGHPHWIVVDEAHHLLPAELDSAGLTIPQDLGSLALVTVHPEKVATPVRNAVNMVIAIGPDPAHVVREVRPDAGSELNSPDFRGLEERSGEMLVWNLEPREARRVTLEPPKAELRRHKRKYATGELGEDKSFYFRGPDGKLNLRVQNLMLFAQIAEGIDDATWLYHLRQHDYSTWLRKSVKDTALAHEVAAIENDDHLAPKVSRTSIIDAIRKQYTAPA